eukprot:Platyproteum_vivax@DN4942_c0_g1_i1.p2
MQRHMELHAKSAFVERSPAHTFKKTDKFVCLHCEHGKKEPPFLSGIRQHLLNRHQIKSGKRNLDMMESTEWRKKNPQAASAPRVIKNNEVQCDLCKDVISRNHLSRHYKKWHENETL